MHDEEFDHEHSADGSDYEDPVARIIREQETLELLTVGIDIGSSTSHLLFARVYLERAGQELSSRFVVVDRTVEWRSPILLTPFLNDGTIDADRLSRFVADAYAAAGYYPSEIDSGAVILTGEAIKKKNARAIDEIFASQSGKFVCATAGHKLECILAAHGSGASEFSRTRNACVLHVDMGGGTTKLALVDRGEIVSVAAFAIGGRLLAQDDDGAWTRIDNSAELVARELGIDATPSQMADESSRQAIVRRLATLAVDQICGTPLDELGKALELTEPLERRSVPEYITISGGVAEYIFGHETHGYGDIAADLAAAIVKQLGERLTVPYLDPPQRIRATVIGASQFSVQVSGKTIYLQGGEELPARDVPVVHLGRPLSDDVDSDALARTFLHNAALHDIDLSEPLALSFGWTGAPTYDRLAAVARAIRTIAQPADDRPGKLLAVVVDADIAQSLGRILHEELELSRDLICIDSVELKELDYIDVGAFLDPPGVIPVVIKSLLFS